MTAFILKRLAISIPIVILSSIIVYVLVATTGDPLADLKQNPNVSQATIELREEQLGLNDPIHIRYWNWITAFVQGDWGTSLRGQDVRELVLDGFGVTFRLVILGALVAVILAVFIGVVSAVRQYSWFDYGGTTIAFIGFSMPVFWLAGIFKDLGIRFNDAIGMRIFFTIGERTPNFEGNLIDTFVNRVGHLALPTATLALVSMAAWSRYQRASMLDVLNSDYVRTARAKGLPERAVIIRHALRNALIPLTTLVAIDFAALIGGAVITETVFAWHGLGRVLLTGINQNDVNVVTGAVFVAALVVIVFNLVADILYGYLDPRIRHGA